MRKVFFAFSLSLVVLACPYAVRTELSPRTTMASQELGNPEIKVWVDTANGYYHCPGSKSYGVGEGFYMTQSQAQQKGYRPAYGWVCR